MTPLTRELDIYETIHRNPVNRAFHAAGIPTIIFAVVGAFGLVRSAGMPWFNGGAVAALVSGYLIGRLDIRSGLALTALALGLDALGQVAIMRLGGAYAAALFAAAFVIGWVIQFVGHAFEGKSPQFVARPLNLLLGPVSVLNDVLPLVRPAPWRRS